MKKLFYLLVALILSHSAWAQSPFITRWNLATAGSGANQLVLNVQTSGTVNYTWETVPAGTSGSGTFSGTTATITGLPTGATIDLSIAPANFQAFKTDINGYRDRNRLQLVRQWGDVAWATMYRAFYDCANIVFTATDNPNLSALTDISEMFSGARAFNGDISDWDVSNVTNMKAMFRNANAFNGDISNWDVSNVTNMQEMFAGAKAFNQDLNDWDVSNVTNMEAMFSNVDAFNQDLNDWDVSNVTNMQEMFYGTTAFNGDISNWDVSNVTNMKGMFAYTIAFNRNISSWDVSNVTNMQGMFASASAFNQDLNDWDVSKVTNMEAMFINTTVFNGDISGWDVSNVTNMKGMFYGTTAFNGDISDWDVSNVTDMNEMFAYTTAFNGDISGWDVSNVTNMKGMFYNAKAFNQDLNDWVVSKVSNMSNMFYGTAAFNGDISDWDVSNVTDMSSMFSNAAAFNQDLPDWNASKVTDMSSMFSNAAAFNGDLSNWNIPKVTKMSSMFSNAKAFNGDISDWDVSNVTSMTFMFNNATAFNGDISDWDLSKVTNMTSMFYNATAFNGDISGWDVNNVTNMAFMFNGTTNFNQDLRSWNISSTTNMFDIFKNSGISRANYDAILIAWDAAGYTNKNLGNASPLKYCAGQTARTNMVTNKGWRITGDTQDCTCPAVATATETMTWTGAVSTDWANACNWSPNGVPTATNPVVIHNDANDPVVLNGTTANCQGMTLHDLAILTINNGGVMNVNSTGTAITVSINASVVNNGTLSVSSTSFYNIELNGGNASVTNSGTLTLTNSTFAGIFFRQNNTVVTNTSTGIINLQTTGRGLAYGSGVTGQTVTNQGSINYSGSGYALAIQPSSFFNNSGTFNITNGPGIAVQGGTLNNLACGKILISNANGTINNSAAGSLTTNAGLIVTPSISNTNGTFTNTGIVTRLPTNGTVNHTANSAVDVRSNTLPIFNYGGTFDGTINGIFTDAAATTSAGTFTEPNTFTPLSLTTQTLYAKITPSGGACTYIVPFTYTPPAITAGAVSNPTTCSGTGSIAFTTINVPNGTYSLSFVASTGATSSPQNVTISSNAFTLSGLTLGTYNNFSLTSYGASAIANMSRTVVEPATPTLRVGTVTHLSTCGGADGSIPFITTNLPDGTYSLSFIGSGGATASPQNVIVSGNAFTLSGLKAGTYSNFSVTNIGCTGVDATMKVLNDPTKPTVSLTALSQTLLEGTNLTLCDTDPNPVNELQFSITTTCLTGSPVWRVQIGSGAWSTWSPNAPVSQLSNNQPHRYQAACDANCPATYTTAISVTINYRAGTPQNVSLVADGTTVLAGEEKSICDQVGNTLTFNATCAAGEILLYSVDGGVYLSQIPTQIVDGNFHNYRVRCQKSDGTVSCVETESGVMRLKISTIAAAPVASLNVTNGCGTPSNFIGTANCGSLTTVWYNATTNVALPNLPTTTPNETTSYYARCQGDVGCQSGVSNTVTFTVVPVNTAPTITVSSDLVCTGVLVTVSANCPAGSKAFWNTGVSENSFNVSFNNVTTQGYSARCIFENGCQSPVSELKTVRWKAFELTIINIGQSKSAIKTNDRAAWASQFVTADGGPNLDNSTEINPTLYFTENANKTGPRYWTIHADACALGTNGSLTFDMLASPEGGVQRSFNTHENNAPYFMYANRDGYTELYAQNHPAYGFYEDNGSGGNIYDAGLPKGLYKLGIRYWDQKGQGSIYPSTRQAAGKELAYQEYWFRIQSKDGVGVGAARVASENNLSSRRDLNPLTFAEVAPNPVATVLRLKVSDAKGQQVKTILMDASGRELLSHSFTPETNQHQEEFNVSELANGMYFLKVNAGEKQATLKVVKVE